ncbi:52 kDa repressor of the inhibitor of the protein kinase isoform X2 [Nilaparvata lugens]|uniref:52 kDa repressor of the inhibitor of the protein kinase isoform X2 n=1 Tax=Nilaparvata lugens TaxID=108931 RepID=UPI000B983495|nr:52 kDa repressor of the inhibitor of the protein kinase isoform X2 [Nilaparvata lugens]
MYRKRKGGRWCSAPNCHRNSNSYPGMTFFRFPKDDERARKWIVNCKRQDLFGKDANYLHQNLKLCSLHFEDKMIANFLKNRLKPDAVPTLFPVSNPPKLNQTKLFVDSIQTSSRFYDGLSQNEFTLVSGGYMFPSES